MHTTSVGEYKKAVKMPAFSSNIPGPLKIGDRIEIAGKFKDKAKRMSVSLCSDDGEEPQNVVLHFDVRFERDVIVTLSRKDGVWVGSGNYDVNYNMFSPGAIFHIIFVLKDSDVISIYCQGKFHSNFLPKIPISFAKYMVVWADVKRVTHCFFHMCCLKAEENRRDSPKDQQVINTLKTDEHHQQQHPPNECSDDDRTFAEKFLRENLTYNISDTRRKIGGKSPWKRAPPRCSSKSGKRDADRGDHHGYEYGRKPLDSSDVSD